MDKLTEVGNCLSRDAKPDYEDLEDHSSGSSTPKNDLEVTKTIKKTNNLENSESSVDAEDEIDRANISEAFTGTFTPIRDSGAGSEAETSTASTEDLGTPMPGSKSMEMTGFAPLKRQKAMAMASMMEPTTMESYHTAASGPEAESDDSSTIFERTVEKGSKFNSLYPYPFSKTLAEYNKDLAEALEESPGAMSTPISDRRRTDHDVVSDQRKDDCDICDFYARRRMDTLKE